MELLSPAGNYEKLKAAVAFGADAVYFGGPAYGLRAKAGNFSFDEMEHALGYLHERGKKGYVTVNIFPSNSELEDIEKYIKICDSMNIDAFIAGDPGVFSIIKSSGARAPVFISTQANTTNIAAVNFWASQGASRVIMARETSGKDLAATARDARCDIEAFIHGAMCISMSGRCLISAYMTGRDANRGECSHPCRWNYALMEETRRGEFFPVYEDERGTYLYNSKDLCLLNRIGELAGAGIKSGKIEGRMKSVMYVSFVTGVYRAAVDKALKDPASYSVEADWPLLLNSVSNRKYTEGFYSGSAEGDSVNFESGGYVRNADFLGVVEKSGPGETRVAVRAKFCRGDKLTFIEPGLKRIDITTEFIYDQNGVAIDCTKPNYTYSLKTPCAVKSGSILARF